MEIFLKEVGYGATAKAVSTAEAERKMHTICGHFSFEGYRIAEQPTAAVMSKANEGCRTALINQIQNFLSDFFAITGTGRT